MIPKIKNRQEIETYNYDTNGALKMKGNLQSEISLANLSPGMYFLKFGDTIENWNKIVKI